MIRPALVPVDRPGRILALLDEVASAAAELSAGEALAAVERAARVEAILRGRYVALAAAAVAPHGPSDPQEPCSPRFLDAGAAAAYIGVSKSTLLRRAKAGKIPIRRPSPGTVRFDREDLDAYMNNWQSGGQAPTLMGEGGSR